ncbi:hypothetical protein [Haloquadratum walsbyi]|uniref:Uncharacterized protein n=1 Tax=Haloquadratum walsbyi J07HQW2 TaxID=1238425 RepID=U1PRT8_9EURY|nr:hypothetical protein [Haloquadratum walsbyi]ERG95071.1 MAG: hypothetical protein J07HQW2_01516 [Haloquadratum walsbyi J07HQW2]
MNRAEVDADDLELLIKRTTGDTIEERLRHNAYYNILPAWYPWQDAESDPAESQK